MTALLGPDHYYRLTAQLAAQDLRRPVSWTIAVTTVILGVIPVGLISSSAGPHGAWGPPLAIAVAALCSVMAIAWLTHHWPARGVSLAFVIISALCAATDCIITAQPMLGLLGAVTFAALSAFTVLFHGARLLIIPWTIGAATLAVLGFRIAQTDPVVAVCGALLIVMLTAFVTSVGSVALRLIDVRSDRAGQLDQVTGLLNRNGFDERLAALIGARNRGDDRFLAVMVIDLDGFSLHAAISETGAAIRARVAIGARLNEAVRRDTLLAHNDDAQFLVAEVLTTPDPTPLTDRLGSAVATAPYRLTASIGVVTTPLHPLVDAPATDVIDELLTLAAEQVSNARLAGGNEVRMTQCPPLAVLAAANDGDEFSA
ncbi:diguanylate cyclase domain-containing protein [Mycolicibacterium lacusdiani]|uniref:diguanylate cyclase domain-containing protein n=1 Tax=Mycolicibacterium lacusdiani TaxID=2895283 RepID=UPI001F350D45|nr:diguanylate cyclase [Mycolicibacterium lacusdiani]